MQVFLHTLLHPYKLQKKAHKCNWSALCCDIVLASNNTFLLIRRFKIVVSWKSYNILFSWLLEHRVSEQLWNQKFMHVNYFHQICTIYFLIVTKKFFFSPHPIYFKPWVQKLVDASESFWIHHPYFVDE